MFSKVIGLFRQDFIGLFRQDFWIQGYHFHVFTFILVPSLKDICGKQKIRHFHLIHFPWKRRKTLKRWATESRNCHEINSWPISLLKANFWEEVVHFVQLPRKLVYCRIIGLQLNQALDELNRVTEWSQRCIYDPVKYVRWNILRK